MNQRPVQALRDFLLAVIYLMMMNLTTSLSTPRSCILGVEIPIKQQTMFSRISRRVRARPRFSRRWQHLTRMMMSEMIPTTLQMYEEQLILQPLEIIPRKSISMLTVNRTKFCSKHTNLIQNHSIGMLLPVGIRQG